MTKQYWVGDFFIDLSRNQITQKGQPQILAPKALAVLTYLAENKGQVVSHDDLLNHVWKDTVVSPNTLQRSIAQLRKAMGDDGKVQTFIKTHAKKGYSLESDVRWSNGTESIKINSSNNSPIDQNYSQKKHNTLETKNKLETNSSKLNLVFGLIGLALLAVFGYQYFSSEPQELLTFDTIRSLTATDDKEFDANYTPDGQYIVFNRYLDKMCVNKLWAKNIKTQQEFQLTKDWGAYGAHSFSIDGNELVFLATEACSEPMTQRNCYDLVSLNFDQALASPQDPKLILQCQNSDVKKPIWLKNGDIAMLQKTSDRWKLISYSNTDNESTDLYKLKEGTVIDYTYSSQDDLIAVTSIHNDDQQYIELLTSDGRLLSSNQIAMTDDIPQFRLISPTFDPLNKQLIFSTGRQLFNLSYEGQVTKISLPFVDRMAQPVFHPKGERMLMLKGPYDSDIVLLPTEQLSEQIRFNQTENYPSFQRTNLSDGFAKFQPNGNLIAFRSERSGDQQIWVSDRVDSKPLTQLPIDTSIAGLDWAADGKSLLVNANNVLTQVFLDAQQKTYPLEHPVLVLFQWDSKNNTALLLLRVKGVLKIVEYNLDTKELNELTGPKALWALRSDDGRLIYKDHLKQFWQPGPVEHQLIKPLKQQGGKAKSFIINDNVIYDINDENQLWSFDLNTQTYQIIGKVTDAVDNLSDINQEQLLMTIQVSAKKEVVELTTSE